MNIIFMTCVIVLTVTFVFLALQLIDTLKQVKNTACAVEKLAANANDRLTDIQPAFQAVNSVTSAVTSGWGKLITTVAGLFKKGS
ncbi:MAG: hypothetical protein COT17_02010 [Elusimicrobia bacterium CG08_land_8_20_14_0_20_51_18]|nr:MAG: hypothetical protein COT17_02010 [Elusimicrobia bacterium CG08_land_8_20_14_0_20_51_18]